MKILKLMLLIMFLVLISSCGANNEFQPADMKSENEISSAKMKKAPGDNKRIIREHFLVEGDETQKRFLEYHVTLEFTTDDFSKSRETLRKVISLHGFLTRSSTTTRGKYPLQNARFRVRRTSLMDVIKACDAIGRLRSETVTANDHTGNIMYTNIKIGRGEKRVSVKDKVSGKTTPGGKSWRDIKKSQELSEDQLDKARFKKWSLMDRIEWSTFNVSIQGPKLDAEPETITVPSFQNALITALNLFLQLLYGITVLLPIIIVISIILIYRNKMTSGIKKLLRRNKKK